MKNNKEEKKLKKKSGNPANILKKILQLCNPTYLYVSFQGNSSFFNFNIRQ